MQKSMIGTTGNSIVGVVGTFLTLAHLNELVGLIAGTFTAGYMGLKFWRLFKKTFLTAETRQQRQEEQKEETTV